MVRERAFTCWPVELWPTASNPGIDALCGWSLLLVLDRPCLQRYPLRFFSFFSFHEKPINISKFQFHLDEGVDEPLCMQYMLVIANSNIYLFKFACLQDGSKVLLHVCGIQSCNVTIQIISFWIVLYCGVVLYYDMQRGWPKHSNDDNNRRV